MNIELIDNATQGVKFEVTLDELQEMAECIHDCSWVSSEEVYAYMKGCVAGGEYEPEDWSVDGRGQVAKSRDLIVDNEL